MRLVRGRSTPAIRAMSVLYPCRCLCFWFEQITRTTPRRRTILHLSQIRFTDARTFIITSRRAEARRLRTSNLLHDAAARYVALRHFLFPPLPAHPGEQTSD